MARGDKWEISLAAPIPNYRFAEWPVDVSLGPVGWTIPSNVAAEIRQGGRSADSYLHVTQTTASSQVFASTGARSLSPIGSSFAPLYVYKTPNSGSVQVVWLKSNGAVASVSTGNWYVNVYWTTWPISVTTLSDISSCQVRFYSSTAGYQYSLSEVVVRWTPTHWSSVGYDTLDSFPEPDGLYYGPLGGDGDLRISSSAYRTWGDLGSRPEKWVLRANYSRLEEADFIKLQRYWMAGRGMLDGYPRPVAIRPHLRNFSSILEVGPEVLVGFFSGFSFEPTGGLARHYSGSFVLEEL